MLRFRRFTEKRADIDAFNARSRWRKRGIAITPHRYIIHYGTFAHGSAVVHVYADGTVDVGTGPRTP